MNPLDRTASDYVASMIIQMGSTELSLLRQFFASTAPQGVRRDSEEENPAISSNSPPGSESQSGAEWKAGVDNARIRR